MTRADAPKRSRRAPARLDTGGDTTGLALVRCRVGRGGHPGPGKGTCRMLTPTARQAIRKSLAEQRRTDVHLPEAPVFRPTAAQFRDPLAFIASVREAGERSGLVRIIPPAGVPPLRAASVLGDRTEPPAHLPQAGRTSLSTRWRRAT